MIGIGSAWLYARKSSYHGKLKDRGRSVDEQLEEGREWCDDNDIPVAGQFIDDDRSASPMAEDIREEFERMLEYIEAGRIPRGDLVVTWEDARLYRKLDVYSRLRKVCWDAGVFLCIAGDLIDFSKRGDRKRTANAAVDAEDQAYEISERVKRSMRANARRGRPHGPGLFGYTRHYDTRTGELVEVVVNEAEARIVREIFDRVAASETQISILEDLNVRGIPSPSNSCCNRLIGAELVRLRGAAGLSVEEVASELRWKPRRLGRVEAGTYGLRLDDLQRMCRLYGVDEGTVGAMEGQWRRTPQWTTAAQFKKMLRNRAYLGRRMHLGKDSKAMWPAIVKPVVFHQVGLILADPGRRTQQTTEVTHLLAGLGDCGVEGCTGVSRSAGRRSPGGDRLYKCNDRFCFQVRADVVERYVVAHLVLRFARHDAAEIFAVRGHGSEIEALNARIVKWESDLAEAEQMVKDGQLTVARLANLEALIDPQIKSTQRELGRMRVNPLLGKLIQPDAEAVYAEWNRLSLKQQRAVIRSELRIVISPIGKGRRRRPVEEYVDLSWRRPGV